jgi:hypothetical protein
MEKAEADATGRKEIEAKFAGEGLGPHQWGNAPNYEYDRHSHGYHKVLYCVSGSIVFHTEEGDFELKPGDRLESNRAPSTPRPSAPTAWSAWRRRAKSPLQESPGRGFAKQGRVPGLCYRFLKYLAIGRRT